MRSNLCLQLEGLLVYCQVRELCINDRPMSFFQQQYYSFFKNNKN